MGRPCEHGHLWQSLTFYTDRCMRCGAEEALLAPEHLEPPNRGNWDEWPI